MGKSNCKLFWKLRDEWFKCSLYNDFQSQKQELQRQLDFEKERAMKLQSDRDRLNATLLSLKERETLRENQREAERQGERQRQRDREREREQERQRQVRKCQSKK